jgi:CheY-like chemotaxis protein
MTKILIAEDNAVNRELLCELLSGEYQIVEAADGQEAVAKVEETRPDLVLLDINMPVLDGFAVLQCIRQNPDFAHLPVIAVTAYAMKSDRERILLAGFNGYVSKPINAAALVGEVEALLN